MKELVIGDQLRAVRFSSAYKHGQAIRLVPVIGIEHRDPVPTCPFDRYVHRVRLALISPQRDDTDSAVGGSQTARERE